MPGFVHTTLGLAFGRRLDQHAGRLDAAASGDLFQDLVGNGAAVDDRLHALETRTIIELYEGDTFGVAPGADPTPQCDRGAYRQSESLLDADRFLVHTPEVSKFGFECQPWSKCYDRRNSLDGFLAL